MSDYHNIKGYYSNSFLSKVAVEILGLPQLSSDKPCFAFGNEFEDCLLYDKKTKDPIIKKMVKVTKGHPTFKSFINHPDIKIQHEYYGRFMGIPFKAKADLLIKGFCVPDIKSTSCTTIKKFIESIYQYNYDRQLYIYMSIFKCDMAVIIATTKEKNPKVFVVPIVKNDYVYNSGKSKAIHLISIVKSL